MKTYVIPTALALTLLASCSYCTDDLDVHRTAARQFVEAINSNDLGSLDAVVSQDVVRHSRATPGVEVQNLEDFKNYIRRDKQSVPDSEISIEIMVADADYVAMLASYRGTQTGAMGPYPATNKPVDLRFIGILRFSDGKIVEIWAEWDNLSLFASLGLLQLPPGAD
jgi:steroid delta-isomerase-like uncharacterized protein